MALGVMGYVAAALELHEQVRHLGIAPDKVFVTSLGATHAGLELGARILGDPWEVIGVAYQPCDPIEARRVIVELAAGGAGLLGKAAPESLRVEVHADESGSAYGASTQRSREALRLAATSDALILDPTYTAKGFAGMLRWIEEGRSANGETVIFIHTGGTPGLFARTWKELCEQ